MYGGEQSSNHTCVMVPDGTGARGGCPSRWRGGRMKMEDGDDVCLEGRVMRQGRYEEGVRDKEESIWHEAGEVYKGEIGK